MDRCQFCLGKWKKGTCLECGRKSEKPAPDWAHDCSDRACDCGE